MGRPKLRNLLRRGTRDPLPRSGLRAKAVDTAQANKQAEASIQQRLDLALRIGEVLLDSGAGAATVTSTMRNVATAMGLEDCAVDVTYTSITVSYQPTPETFPVTTVRVVQYRSIDYTRMAGTETLVRRLLAGEIGPESGHEQMDRIVSAPHPYPRWLATLAWAGMATSVAVLLGATAIIGAVAFVTTVLIYVLNRWLGTRGLPVFYQQAAGAALATTSAVALIAADISVQPSLVVAAGIIVLLSGLSLFGAVQDALNGFMVTASGRMFEVILMTAGLLLGVVIVLRAGVSLGVQLTLSDPIDATITRLPLQILSASAAATCFALACYAPKRVLTAAALAAGIGYGIYALLTLAQLGTTTASGIAAVAIGFGSANLGGRWRIPPLIIAVSGITPLLPGLGIYSAFFALAAAQDVFNGISLLLEAIGTALVLAAGVSLGEVLGQPLRVRIDRLRRSR